MTSTGIAPLKSVCLVVVVASQVVSVTLAQDNRLLPPGDRAYDAIVFLQRRGHLLELNPTSLPYRYGDVREALARIDTTTLGRSARHRVRLLKSVVRRTEGEAAFGYSFEAGARLMSGNRLDVLRPLADSLNVWWYGAPATVYADAGPIVAELGIRQDSYFDDDPDGLDVGLRLLSRSEHTYVGWHERLFSVYLGRFGQHWSVPGEAATVLSANAHTQDQIVLRLGGERLSVLASLRELDSITDDGRFTGRVADDTVRVGNRRRYLAVHRWDWRPSRRLSLSIMESVVYSGANAGPSLRYLNPLHPAIVVVDNRPKNEENNGMVAGLVWAQARRFTVHGQLMVDDINVQGIGNETLTYAFAGSVVYALGTADIGGSLTAVSSRTYNAPQPEGKYVYLLRGLATQFSDYVLLSTFADVYVDHFAPGLVVSPRLDWLRQGERDIRQPFPAKDQELKNILDGTVMAIVRPALRLSWQPSPWWWVRADVGVNFVHNAGHVTGSTESRFVGLVEAGFRVRLDRALELSWGR